MVNQSVHPKQLFIDIRGAREHNLKNINARIPRYALTVITGLSGSGKSSLAFDTIYAEGQRRYMETFSAYARSYIGNMQRPDVDKITGLSPVISIDQRTTVRNPRSTVGTITEIYDFLRLLYARVADAYSTPLAKRWFITPMNRLSRSSSTTTPTNASFCSLPLFRTAKVITRNYSSRFVTKDLSRRVSMANSWRSHKA